MKSIQKRTILFSLFTVFIFTLNGGKMPIPIIYDPDYNITLLGVENFLHSFDTKKYGKVAEEISNHHKIEQFSFSVPKIVSDDDLLTVHTQDYLDSLSSSKAVAKVAEVWPLAFLPNFILQRNLLAPIKLATGGTILGAELALKHGWAINLSGGYHHAKAENGGGFCFFADISIAVYKVLKKQSDDFKVLIIDLDAHQGNGHEAIFKDDPQIRIFDIYGKDNYPHDKKTQKYIDFDYGVKFGITTEQYLKLLKEELPKAIAQINPNLIVYNAGTDIFEKDHLGVFKVSAEGIIERDEFVFEQAKTNKIPILMLLSGGYTQESAKIISDSIKNLLEKEIISATDALEVEY